MELMDSIKFERCFRESFSYKGKQVWVVDSDGLVRVISCKSYLVLLNLHPALEAVCKTLYQVLLDGLYKITYG